MLNVVHISFSAFGGAGRAAFRLHEGMINRSDIHSTFISSDFDITTAGSNHLIIGQTKNTLVHKIASFCGLGNQYQKSLLLRDIKGDYEIYSKPVSNYNIEALEVIKSADIINLHWVSNFVNFPTFFKAVENKPIVWTLHDMNPFMGGFHYKNDFDNNQALHATETDFFNLKKQALMVASNINIITPSNWLLTEAIESEMFSDNTSFDVIPYSLNLSKFKPIEKKYARQKLGLNPDLPCILIIAQYLNNYRKGADLAIDALKTINTKHFQVLTIGENLLKIEGEFEMYEMGSVHDDEILALAYSAADLFVLPSREDNLPNVMLEAFACGTPVLSFQIGGMKDWIIPGFNGIFAETNDAAGIRNEIEKFISSGNIFESETIRKFAENTFSPNIQVDRYMAVYHKIQN